MTIRSRLAKAERYAPKAPVYVRYDDGPWTMVTGCELGGKIQGEPPADAVKIHVVYVDGDEAQDTLRSDDT